MPAPDLTIPPLERLAHWVKQRDQTNGPVAVTTDAAGTERDADGERLTCIENPCEGCPQCY